MLEGSKLLRTRLLLKGWMDQRDSLYLVSQEFSIQIKSTKQQVMVLETPLNLPSKIKFPFKPHLKVSTWINPHYPFPITSHNKTMWRIWELNQSSRTSKKTRTRLFSIWMINFRDFPCLNVKISLFRGILSTLFPNTTREEISRMRVNWRL